MNSTDMFSESIDCDSDNNEIEISMLNLTLNDIRADDKSFENISINNMCGPSVRSNNFNSNSIQIFKLNLFSLQIYFYRNLLNQLH